MTYVVQCMLKLQVLEVEIHMRKGLGWKPDLPDQRDYDYTPSTIKRQARRADLRERFPRCWQQGTLGSCTAHSVAAACLFRDIYDRDQSIVVPSRLFLYYATRVLEGTVATDAGAEIRSAIKAAMKFGYPPEDVWPYRISRFASKPTPKAFRAAESERIRKYERVSRDLRHFRKLLNDGYPVAIGFSVYESVYQAKVDRTGRIPMPKRKEKLEGGHAVLVVGYDDGLESLIIRNSWGTAWGEGGYGYLPYGFIEETDLSDDFWVIR